MGHVYVVQHVREFGDGREDVKFIGVYSSPERARDAVDRLRYLPGFVGSPDGFSVDRYEMDRDHWSAGFG